MDFVSAGQVSHSDEGLVPETEEGIAAGSGGGYGCEHCCGTAGGGGAREATHRDPRTPQPHHSGSASNKLSAWSCTSNSYEHQGALLQT